MTILLDGYALIKNQVQEYLENIFYAADLNNDEQIEYLEFLNLFTNVEKGSENEAKNLFFSHFDIEIPLSGNIFNLDLFF